MKTARQLMLIALMIAFFAPFGWAKKYWDAPAGQGNSTIGVGGDYSSLALAIADFNTTAPTGNWTMQVLNDLTEPANIGAAQNTGANIITLKPAAGRKVTITFTQLPDNAGPTGHLVIGSLVSSWSLKAVNNFVIDGSNNGSSSKDLTIQNISSSAYGYGGVPGPCFIRVVGESDSVTFKNCIIKQLSTKTTSYGVRWETRNTASINYTPDNGLVQNCDIICNSAVQNTAFMTENSGGTLTANAGIQNMRVLNCNLRSTWRAIYLHYYGSGEYAYNTIDICDSAQQNIYSICIDSSICLNATVNIHHNRIAGVGINAIGNTQVMYGIQVLGQPGDTVAKQSTFNIYCNEISGFYIDSGYIVNGTFRGINIMDGVTLPNVNIYNNSVQMSNFGAAATDVRAIYGIGVLNTAYLGDVNVRNNMIYMGVPSGSGLLFGGLGAGATLVCDYNNVFADNNASFGFWGDAATGVVYKTLGSWQIARSLDLNSKTIDPTIIQAGGPGKWPTSAHFDGTVGASTYAGLDLTALPLPGISLDIDGQPYSPEFPMGADNAAVSATNLLKIAASVSEGPAPHSGLYGFNAPTTVTLAGSSYSYPYQIGAVGVRGDDVSPAYLSRYNCTGFTGTGAVPATGSGNETTAFINVPSTIAWNYQPLAEGYLDVVVLPGDRGAVTPAAGYKTTALNTVTATANSGEAFFGFSGDLTGVATPQDVTMAGVKRVTAYFAPKPKALTQQWMVKRSENRRWWLNRSDRQIRSGRFNPVTGHYTLLSRSNLPTGTNGNLVILNGTTGDEITTNPLSNTIVTGGTNIVNMHAVRSDGRIYFCNLTTAARTTAFKIYRLDNETAAPVVAFNATIAHTADNRVGDTLTVVGTGNDTIIYAGTGLTTVAHIYKFTTSDGGNTFGAPTAIAVSGVSTACARLGINAVGTGASHKLWVNSSAESVRQVDTSSPYSVLNSITATQEPFAGNSCTVSYAEITGIGKLVAIGPGNFNAATGNKKGYLMQVDRTGKPYRYAETASLQDIVGYTPLNGDGTGQVDFDPATGRVFFTVSNNTVSSWFLPASNPDINVPVVTNNFGNQNLIGYAGGAAVNHTFDIQNTGTSSLNIVNVVKVSGSADFAIDSYSTLIPAGATTGTLKITYTPNTRGAVSATFRIASEDPDESVIDVTVSAFGVAPKITLVSANSYNFGANALLLYGGSAKDYYFVAKNDGNTTLSLSGLVPASSSDFAQGAITKSALPADGTTTAGIQVIYTPITAGAVNAGFSLSSNDPGAAPALSVQASGSTPNVALSAASTDWGERLIGGGAQADKKTLRISNTGGAPLTVSNVAASGSADIVIDPVSPTSFVLPAGSQQDILLIYTPTTIGPITTTIQVTSNDPDSGLLTQAFTGTGSNIVNSPAAMDFGFKRIASSGGQTTTQSLQVVNGSALSTTYTLFLGNAEFGIVGAAEQITLASSTVTWVISYLPSLVADSSATYTLASSNPACPDLAGTISGRGWKNTHGKKAAIDGLAGGTIQVEADGLYTASKIVIPAGAYGDVRTITIQEPTDTHGKPQAIELLISGAPITFGAAATVTVEFKLGDVEVPGAEDPAVWYVNNGVALYDVDEWTDVGAFSPAQNVGGVYTAEAQITSFSLYATKLNEVKKTNVSDWQLMD